MTDTKPLFTISGRLASGTTTMAEHIRDEYEFEMISGGDIFRRQAKERGYTLDEFTALAEEDDSIDKELDRRLKQIAIDHSNGDRKPDGNGLVIESRIIGWLASDVADVRVWLDAPLKDRLKRIEGRKETIEEARRREASEESRYRDYHGIDINDTSGFDLVINTTNWDEDGVKEIIGTSVSKYL